MSDPSTIFVFDKDGVLVDSEPIKLRLFEEMFATGYPEAVPAIRRYSRENVGLARRDKLHHVLGTIIGVREGLDSKVQRYLDHSYHFVRNALITAPPVPGVLRFICRSAQEKYVCSSALQAEVDDQLQALAIEDHFQAVYAFPDEKTDALSQLRAHHPTRPIVFWGDTLLDYRASRSAQVTFIGVGRPDANPFEDLEVHTIPDFQDHVGLHAWIASNAVV